MYHAITRRPGIYTRKRQLAYLLMRYRVFERRTGIKPPAFLVADFSARKGM